MEQKYIIIAIASFILATIGTAILNNAEIETMNQGLIGVIATFTAIFGYMALLIPLARINALNTKKQLEAENPL